MTTTVNEPADLDALWGELLFQACASDGPIRDADVRDAIRIYRLKIERAAAERAIGAAPDPALAEKMTRLADSPRSKWHDEVLPNGAGDSWACVPIGDVMDALPPAERAIGAEALVGCYHGQPHRCSRCGFEWPAARLTRERSGQ